MPRIDPLKLLVCLSVLLAPNGGIRSANEVKRLANLMAKFSKKLVSKCIYIQILKCTETELLGQFMAAGGWSLVHMWLADGITTKNWPLIQELLELLLCCPVDVERLKSNTAPKLVKSLSKDSSHEGVRLLASKLVEQWLKIARNDIRSSNTNSAINNNHHSSQPQSTPPQPNTVAKVDDDCVMQEEEEEDVQEQSQEVIEETQDVDEDAMVEESILPDDGPVECEPEQQQEQDDTCRMVEEQNGDGEHDKDEAETSASEGNAKKSPLLFKITMKNGKQMLAKVESPTKAGATDDNVEEEKKEEKKTGDTEKSKDGDKKDEIVTTDLPAAVDENDSIGKPKDEDIKPKGEKSDESNKDKEHDRRKSSDSDRSKEKSSSKDKDRSRDKDKDKDRKSSSSSSSHRSSSKSSSSKHNSSSSSNSSKSKSSSSSSSSKSSSSSSRDKDKERDRHGSSSSSSSKSHHNSSSSSSSSQKSSSKSSSSSEKHREHRDKDKGKDKSSHTSKDKEGQSKLLSPSVDKLSKISRKSKDSEEEKSNSTNHKSSPVSATKKASISIEVRNAEHRPKTVKTYNSQFRSHGLIEEAPPPPSRKGLKKPSQPPTTPPVIGSTATGTIPVKRSSPPPFTREGPPEKRVREDPTERPGAIKLIPAKRQPSLVESDMFMDALSATLKKDVKKRKRRPSGSESTKSAATDKAAAASAAATQAEKSGAGAASSPEKPVSTPPASPTGEKQIISPSLPSPTGTASSVPTEPSSPAKVIAAPMSFYRDTLAETEENAEEKKEGEENDKEKMDVAQTNEEVELKSDEILDTPAEPDDADDEVIRKPKRLKSELIDDDDADEKGSLIDAVGDDLTKKIAMLDSAQTEVPDIPVKKPPGPGCGPDGPPGVLVIHRRKGPKKQLKWKAQDDLEEIRYFELDVTERCNVTKTFTDLKQMERVDERQKYILSRKLQTEDIMVERTAWLPLIIVDNVTPHPDGLNSQERRIQRDRERTVLQALYFNRHMIPDSPAEPDVEVYSISEPAHIPMEDVTGNPDSVNDFTTMPWPEPKSTPPNESTGFNSPFFPGSANDFPPFGNSGNWDLPGASTGPSPNPIPSLFAPGRIPMGMPSSGGGNNRSQSGGQASPNMMRQMNMQSNIPPNMPPHPNMFSNNYVRGPPPPQMQHMLDAEEDNFRNGPPPPPSWFNNNRGPPQHMGGGGNFNNNRGGFGNNRGGNNWNNNRDNDRGGSRGGNYRPPWLQNRGNHRGGRKW